MRMKIGFCKAHFAQGLMMGKLIIAAAAVMLVCVTAAGAQVTETPNFSFNGFGTFGVVRSDEDQADFASNLFSPDGAGYTRDWSPEVDNVLGLQLTANLTSRLTGILQVVSKQRYDETYTPFVEWANLKFDITPDLSVRAGRMVQQTFMVSEYRKVRYATPWIRPPKEVYDMIPVTNADGIDFSYRFHFDGFTNTLRGLYGTRDVNIPDGSEANARDVVVLSNTLERGAATLFACYGSFRLTMKDFDPFFDAFRQFGEEGEAIADRYDIGGKRFEIMSFGSRYDPGKWFVMGEWALAKTRTFIGDIEGLYITGGYRFGEVTPYMTLARARPYSDTSDPGLSLAGLSPEQAAQAEALNAALNEMLGSATNQKSISVGVRWDFIRNADLKVQYQYLDLGDGSPGVLINRQPGFEPGGSVNLFSAAIDFVF
ncbi:MAG: porin [Candidatus Krumholzibacteriota bacterium]|nr:porin [Candidatus Krumholzibacteriota bacterium]